MPVFEQISIPSLQRPGRPPVGEPQSRLNVFVLFTSVQATLAALKEAGRLAAELGGRIILMELQVVPYPLPLDRPPVAMDWNERRLRLIAGERTGHGDVLAEASRRCRRVPLCAFTEESRVETIVHVYLCRDARQTLKNVLGPHALVVLGGRKRWWPTREQRLAHGLRRQGHEVILIEAE